MAGVDEMISIVQVYIHHRKGVEVDISMDNLDMIKLFKAYNYAVNWLNSNNFKVV